MVAIVGEEWEAGFARATARSLAVWLPADAKVCVPAELERTVAGVCPGSLHIAAAARSGFQQYEEIRRRILQEAKYYDGLLLLAAGTLPGDDPPLERLGAPWRQERVIEWHPATKDSSPTILRFRQPPHRPPPLPRHTVKRVGALNLWTIDGGSEYFQALLSLNGAGSPPIWSQYGARRPIFAYNTNDFSEPPISTHDEYFILGSGLLGLRLIAESRPAAGTRVVVYDINPDQLLWIKYVLEACREIAELEDVIRSFRTKYETVEVRPVLRHEDDNASLQAEWYRSNRQSLYEIGSALNWEFLECDLWNDPVNLLSRVRPVPRLFFMYLDLFMVWRIEEDLPWVENHAGAALSLENSVKTRAKGQVTFLPGDQSARFQLPSGSPFAMEKG
jgi:hypothetical protein